jgi:simple sugar transport system ATP-binding protein
MTATAPIVRGANLSKAFGATPALRDVSIEVHPGEIRALVGRNGAGKSTLVSMLTGMHEPDAGTIHFSGHAAPECHERELWQRNVACVYQHPKIIPTLSCAENLFVGDNMRRRTLLSWRTMRREARAVLERWGLQVDVEARAGDLNVAERQLLEIARAMLQGSRFLILDEPTAKLSAKEIERLFIQMVTLKSGGVGILFISHHLDEIFHIADTVTVLRDGRKVLDRLIGGLDRSALIEAMVGSTHTSTVRSTAATTGLSGSQVRLEVQDLSCKGFFDAVSFRVRSTECVGLAGLTGSGKEAIGEVLAGLKDFDAGTIRLDRIELPGGDVSTHNRLGMGFVPQDRHREGLVLGLSVAENATMTISDQLGAFGFINPQTLENTSRRLIERLGIKTAGPDQPVSSLSGGNQQKVVLARALARDPKALVLINPTSGVDVASKAALFASIRDVASRGAAVLVISDELEELALCDRVLVIRSHRLTREFLPPFSDRDLVAEMEGLTA